MDFIWLWAKWDGAEENKNRRLGNKWILWQAKLESGHSGRLLKNFLERITELPTNIKKSWSFPLITQEQNIRAAPETSQPWKYEPWMYIKVSGLDKVTFAIHFQLPKALQSHGGTYWHYFKDKETEAQRLAHSQAHTHFHSQFARESYWNSSPDYFNHLAAIVESSSS